jgi:hypothetical protein
LSTLHVSSCYAKFHVCWLPFTPSVVYANNTQHLVWICYVSCIGIAIYTECCIFKDTQHVIMLNVTILSVMELLGVCNFSQITKRSCKMQKNNFLHCLVKCKKETFLLENKKFHFFLNEFFLSKIIYHVESLCFKTPCGCD